ncbi:uncharacterized protein K460DRAFT_418802 [Cucurbitaria berberidis CBS 394.84]|uniref:Uncharacterized protein n=1 Tax=Cucurbitaria berberidis CBS 394.84 TaxID=1168544 RepID=A0A9P4GEJ7_9PLEO|nr:uncharacterized protein K460DRAFT_418802 [Cucurbitaria berberidis CBS 394.84]KAF1843804.1 hypothetical protein K460DRAFT_418802 [Cucurbitaria berberidis CBS 394.84]
MKESKRTHVPLPGSKAKSKVKDTSSKGLLSQEFIESDDDSATESTPQSKATGKPKRTIAIHKANGVVKPKSKSSTKENATPKPVSKSKVASNVPTQKQVVTQAQAAELSSSEQTDDNSDSDSGSDSSGDESNTKKAPQPSRTLAQEQASPSKSQSHAVEFRPAQPYVPPRGFNPVPLNVRTTSKAASIFDNLEGKQVWHITAPAGVSLEDLKQVAMDKAMEGEAIWHHEGADYGLSKTEKSEEGTREVLVPQSDGYKAVSARISQTLHLQAVVRLPKLSSKQADQNTGSEAAASITRSTIRAPRPQVRGLKMRFLPTGFGGDAAGILGDSDSESEAPRQTAGLGMPNGLNLPSRKEKRKHADVNGAGTVESPTKKSKKHRTLEDIQKKEDRRAKKMKKRAHEAALERS